jgi:hypothetical protein
MTGTVRACGILPCLALRPSLRFLVVSDVDATISISQRGVTAEMGPLAVLRGLGTAVLSWDEPAAAAQAAQYVIGMAGPPGPLLLRLRRCSCSRLH